jgi:hypothetical protein
LIVVAVGAYFFVRHVPDLNDVYKLTTRGGAEAKEIMLPRERRWMILLVEMDAPPNFRAFAQL